jgi:hypothetical protein
MQADFEAMLNKYHDLLRESSKAAHREAGLRYTKESRRHFVHGNVELSGPAVLIPLAFGEAWSMSWECVPDTADPSGPTGTK